MRVDVLVSTVLGAIALGVAGLAGATTLAYIGGKKAVAMVKDFKEYRKLKKRGALAKAEATEKSADGTEKPIEAEVVQYDLYDYSWLKVL